MDQQEQSLEPQNVPTNVEDSELSESIAKEIIAEIEAFVDNHLSKYEKYTLNAPNCDSQDSTAQFFNLISSLKDVSVLGRKLLEAAPKFDALKSQSGTASPSLADTRSLLSRSIQIRSLREEDANSDDLLSALVESSSLDDFLILSSSLESITIKEMTMAALIFIKSHECFTLAHDVQGVIMVLRKTKFLIINILAPKNQMELITKLLTSIGRYSEMNYVFDLFRDRNQFEILLSKGVEKTPELRIALFNYVKKNPEFYALVTLNFSMFREIAESLEASAINRLSKILASTNKRKTSMVISASSSSSAISAMASAAMRGDTNPNRRTPSFGETATLYPKDNLTYCLVELVDASDCYAKAGCYKRSNNCEKKAKLVALQIAILPFDQKVLDVPQSELNDLIVSFETFGEAFIVAEAYDFHLAWRQALFKNVVLNGNTAYLSDYCQKCDLSSALVMELVLLFKQYNNNGARETSHVGSLIMAKSMKQILSKLQDVELRCKMYTQLGFDDAKEELIRDPAIEAHLRDLKLV